MEHKQLLHDTIKDVRKRKVGHVNVAFCQLLVYTVKQPVHTCDKRNNARIGYQYSFRITSSSTSIHYSAYICLLLDWKIKFLLTSQGQKLLP
uniref:Uncharacterized protein n=1 Tax=Arundo donax TaxID=35708 RepID=A0A0A9E1W5_ARUDO